MLLGRDAERAAIERLLADARVGTSGVLVVSGEPGIGKSALLAYAAERAGDARALGAGRRGRGLDPVRRPARAPAPRDRARRRPPAPQAAALRAALALGPGVSGERLVIGAATLGVLASAAEERPLCVLVDDAHWLDQPSAEAILFAARRLLADPVAIIVAVRSSEPSPLADAGLPTLALTGLDLGASEALLARERDNPLPGGSAERLLRATGGNPLALIELAGEAESIAGSLVEGPLPVATTVERAFAQRASRLSEPARRALLVAAASSNADLGLIVQAGELLGIETGALQEAEAAGLVAVSDGRIEFRHPLVRSAVHSAAEPAERRAVHAALAQTLDDARSADERAWHLGQAAFGPDDAAADALADASARARERGAYAAAALTAERAARLTADDATRGRRLLEAASNAWIAGSGERAVKLLDEAAPLDVDAADVGVEIARLRGYVAVGRGDAMLGREVFAAAARRAAPAGRATARCGPKPASPRSMPDAWSRCSRTPEPPAPPSRRTTTAWRPAQHGSHSGWRSWSAARVTKDLACCGPPSRCPGMRGCSMARRSCGDGPSRLRCSCGRRVRRARRSAGRSPRLASAASRARCHRCSACSRATRRRRIDGPRPGPATTRQRNSPTTPASPVRSALRSRALPGWRPARAAMRAAVGTRPKRSRWRASSGAGSTRPGRWPRSAISSSHSGGRPMPSRR